MPRTLTEQEFNAIRDQVLSKLPDGLTEVEFQRVVGPAMEQAIGIAENSPAPLTGSAMWRALGAFWQRLPNLVDVVKGTAETAAAVMAPAVFAPRVIQGQAQQSRAMLEKARAAPTLSEKVGYGAAAVLPGGAGFAEAGEDVSARVATGDYAGAAGAVTGALAPVLAPMAVPRSVRVPAPFRATTVPAEQRAIALAESRGVPVDAATATGSRLLRNAQKRLEGTIGGAAPVAKFQEAKDAALTRVGGELADETLRSPQTPQSAGAAVRRSTEDAIRTLDEIAEREYGQLRAMEADPRYARDVEVPRPGDALRNRRAAASVGAPLTPDDWRELRRIREELDAMPYQDGGTVRNANRYAGTENDWTDGDMRQSSYVRRAAGAPVYHDILQAAPGTAQMTRADVQNAIDLALNTGRFTNAARGALEVARARQRGSNLVSSPLLPPSAGEASAQVQPMGLPVRVSEAKAALRPIYDRLKREAELVPVQGDKARALTALDRLINGPDTVPVSVADAALSDLKAMARGAAMPELRSKGQGLAAAAVRELEATVQRTVQEAGPEASGALARGRDAVKTKAWAGDTLESLRDEPVRAYDQLTAPRDTNITQLSKFEELAPDAVPKVARAWLDERLDRATQSGRFEHADWLHAEWSKLGDETKRKFYGNRAPDLDAFFLLAKRLNENPNPSGTANVLAVNATQVLGYLPAKALAKILYTPRGVRLLTQGMRLSLKPATRAAGMAAIQEAARAARVQIPAPTAAENQEVLAPASARQ